MQVNLLVQMNLHKDILKEVYKEVQQNKIGFDELCEKHNVEPFKQ